MILTIRVEKGSDHELFSLISEAGHVYLPVRKVPANCYIEGEELAHTLDCPLEQLYNIASNSNSIHAINLPTGCVYFHPDGVAPLISKHLEFVANAC